MRNRIGVVLTLPEHVDKQALRVEAELQKRMPGIEITREVEVRNVPWWGGVRTQTGGVLVNGHIVTTSYKALHHLVFWRLEGSEWVEIEDLSVLL
jgi:hypothetical protein